MTTAQEPRNLQSEIDDLRKENDALKIKIDESGAQNKALGARGVK